MTDNDWKDIILNKIERICKGQEKLHDKIDELDDKVDALEIKMAEKFEHQAEKFSCQHHILGLYLFG